MTPEDIETEFWAYQDLENSNTEDYEDDEFDIQAIIDDDDWEVVINE